MKKLVYLTTNNCKAEGANRIFRDGYGFNLEIMDPSFEILEIQSTNCADVVKFSAEYACEKLGFAVLKSDSGLYIDCLGGLPGPYNAYFDKQIGIEKFFSMLKKEKNRKARLEYCFTYCELGKEPMIFSGGGTGNIGYEAKGNLGRWHDKFYIPDGENKTLSELREIDNKYEEKFWGTAKKNFVEWFKNKID